MRVLSSWVVMAALCAASPATAQETAPEEAEEPSQPADEAPAEAEEDAASPGEAGEPAEQLEDPAQPAEGVPAPPGAAPPRRVAVLILATAGVDAETADSLTELAIGAVAGRGGASIVGKEEFQSQLGQGEARSIECVSSAACLGRIGVELAVDEVIAGTIARRDGKWIFNINRIEIRTGELAGRAFRELEGDLGAVADAIQQAVPELYETVQRPATMLISASVEGAEIAVDGILVGVYRDEPVTVSELSPGRHRVEITAGGHEPWRRTVHVAAGATLQLEAELEEPEAPGEAYVSPLVWVGAGIVAAGVGTAVFFGIRSQGDVASDANRAEAEEYIEARQTDALVANVAMGTIAAGLVVGAIGFALSDLDGADEPAAPRAGVAPVPGGAVGLVEGTF